MKKLRLLGLVGITSIALAQAGWAAPHGGGGGLGGGGFGRSSFGGHPGGGRAASRGGVGFGRPVFSGRAPYYYSRGMHYAAPGARASRFAVQPSRTSATSNRRTINSRPQAVQTRRPTLNGRTDHIAERHQATNWHHDWDRRHAHFFHNRFFVFDDGFWFGLDDGFFPWDYYPYYAYDYYPYDYYPGYYADVEPNYYNEGVYSNTPMVDPTVTAVQTELTQLGYYSGPVDGIFGPTTRDAVAKYQIAKNLDVTGSLSPDTMQSLGLPEPAAS
jgi:hypothetical protein